MVPLSLECIISKNVLIINIRYHGERLNANCRTFSRKLFYSNIFKDVNDERPQFRSSFYAAEIPENAPKGTPVNFLGSAVNEVFDHDLG